MTTCLKTLTFSISFIYGSSERSLTLTDIFLSSEILVILTFIVCPIVFKFFIAMAPESIQIMTDINQYLSFVFKLVFAFGIAFEIPIATLLLIRSGIASKKSMKSARPYLIVFFLFVGMLLTPPDVFSQLFLAIPMWLLFEIGLIISKDKT